ncbi:MAG: proton-conducting transporter membrane subunit [Planctomycetota bacterium]
MIALFIIVPLAAAFLIAVAGKFGRRLPEVITLLVCVLLVALAGRTFVVLRADGFHPLIYKIGGRGIPLGINLVVDGLSMVVVMVTSVVALAAGLFSISYMTKYTSTEKYYALFLLMVSGMNGVALTGDLFNLFVFMEIATVASASLVAFGNEREDLEASFRYLVMGSIATISVLLAVAILYGYTASFNMADVSRVLARQASGEAIAFVTVLFVVGFGIKSAIMPFHAWLPDAHPSAPAPISAMLSGVLIKSLGVYAMVRVLWNVVGVH